MNRYFRTFWFKPLLAISFIALLLAVGPNLLGVKSAYLTTDKLIFVLFAGIVLLVSYIHQRKHLLEPWRQVFRQRRAMISLVVLVTYASIGMLDSIHFRTPLPDSGHDHRQYAVESLSVLDVMLDRLRSQEEKTYSAPFAAYLYSKETVTHADGSQSREYPRLVYGGRQLADPARDRPGDILKTSLIGIVLGAIIGMLLCLLLAWRIAHAGQQKLMALWWQIWKGQTELPWRSLFLTLILLSIAITSAWMLSKYYHVFGTDKVGKDVLYLSIKSIRTGLVIGTLTTLIMLPFAILLGILAGYYRGWVDDAIQYLYTTLSSIPGVLLIAAAILSIQVYISTHAELFATGTQRADLRLLALCVILGITSWTGLCRLLRAETLKLRELDYIQAATALGVKHFVILGRHVLPNVMHIVLIMVVLDFSALVLAEAVLSYVGVGVDPSTISWGNMINGARLELAREPMVWWSLVAAFVLMFALVLPANLFSDAVRDAFDPRLRESR